VKYIITAVLLSSILCVPAFGEKRKADFQAGQIQKIEQLPGQPNANGAAATDSQPDPGVYRYNVFVRVGDTIYTTQLETSDPMDAEFSSGSEVQARVSRRILYLKRASGAVVEASIVGKKKLDAN
jgi:hypothetical protein